MEADGKGKETARNYDEPIEIAIFARANGAKEKPFEVGVDPYNKMIDRVPRDNRKEVSFD